MTLLALYEALRTHSCTGHFAMDTWHRFALAAFKQYGPDPRLSPFAKVFCRTCKERLL